MTFPVAGSRTRRLRSEVAKMVASGAKTVHLFAASRIPLSPSAEPLFPGYVRARMAGAAVWREK